MLVVPDDARMRILRAALRESVTFRLFVNDVWPDLNSRAEDFEEPADLGYTAQACAPDDWEFTTDDFGKPIAEYPKRVWTFQGAVGVIYGYYVTDRQGEILWVERFEAGPFVGRFEDDGLHVTPRIGAP